jgi:peptide/nickel transport system permease protein
MQELWHQFTRSRAAVTGAAVVGFMSLIAILGPMIVGGNPHSMTGPSLAGPSAEYLMGTDDLGRDVLNRFVHGARVSLVVGIVAALVSSVIGILVGSVAGYFGGLADQFMMRVTEYFQVIPRFFLALVLVSLFGSNYLIVIFAIAILGWPPVARLARGEFLSLRERDFVLSLRAVGASRFSIIFREILPNAAPALIVVTTLQISGAILTEASLAFIGLGDPTWPSWGAMLNSSQQFIRDAWWMSVFPGLGIFLTVAAFNLFGDGLNDMLNPRLRGR